MKVCMDGWRRKTCYIPYLLEVNTHTTMDMAKAGAKWKSR
jgi:hypothetical protein